MKGWSVAVLILSVMAMAVVVIAQTERTVRLTYKYDKGEVLHYKTFMKGKVKMQANLPVLEFPDMGVESESKTEKKVLDIDKQGNFLIQMTDSTRLTMTIGEQKKEMQALKQVIQLKMTPSGKILSARLVKQEGQGSAAAPGGLMGAPGAGGFDPSNFLTAYPGFPEKDLKEGESWSINQTISLHDKSSLKITGQGKLVGFDRKGKYDDCAVVQTTVSIPNFSMPLPGGGKITTATSGTFKTWFAVEEGREVYMDGQMRVTQSMTLSPPAETGGGEPVTVKAIAVFNITSGIPKEEDDE